MSEPNVTVVTRPRARMRVKTVTSLGMLTAVAYVLMLLSKMLPQVYTFLQLDIQATAITIGGFLFGPLAAAAISLVVAVVEMKPRPSFTHLWEKPGGRSGCGCSSAADRKSVG